MRTILLNFMLKVGEGNPIPEASSKKLIEWTDANKMKRARLQGFPHSVRPTDILSLGRRKLVAPGRRIERCGDAT